MHAHDNGVNHEAAVLQVLHYSEAVEEEAAGTDAAAVAGNGKPGAGSAEAASEVKKTK